MSFLAILLALGVERAFPQGTALGESRLLALLLRGLKRLDNPALPWLLTLLAVALTIALERLLGGALAGILFGAAALFCCLGPRDLADDVQRLIAAKARGDAVETERLSRALQSGPAPDESHRSLIGALFIQSHERLFGVLLWFMVLGPAAAVGYRLASRLPALLEKLGYGSSAQQSAAQLHGIAAWLPTRISAALFALAGSMDDAMEAWKRVGELHYREPWRSHSWAVLAEVSAGALAMEEEDGAISVAPNLEAALREVLRMQTRALLLLLAGFALYTSGTLV
ncbi:MAG: regulatory signaling modulator protein AmpE [Pseudomonadota bacterium]